VLTEHYDQLDELRFVKDLIYGDEDLKTRLDPGVPLDEIDRYRMRIAQTEGRYVKRTEALGLLRGMKSITEEKKTKQQKKQQAKSDEVIRKAAVEATESGESKPELKSGGGVDKADALLAKRRAGQKLTDAELAIVRKRLEGVEL